MTGTREPQQDGSIQAMLRDSGLESATELRSTLEGLQALVPDQAPAPRADLAALLAGGAPSAVEPAATDSAADVRDPGGKTLPAGVVSLADRRRGSKRRMALIGGAVVGAMTLGAGAVAAASQDFRDTVGHSFGVIFHPAAPSPAPTTGRTTPSDLPAAPAATLVPVQPPAAVIPAAPLPAPSSAATAAPAQTHPAPAATPPAVGRGGVLPTPGQRPANPGFPGQSGKGIPVSPLPTVPAIPEFPTSIPGQP
jgi:hypothetical protein